MFHESLCASRSWSNKELPRNTPPILSTQISTHDVAYLALGCESQGTVRQLQKDHPGDFYLQSAPAPPDWRFSATHLIGPDA
jgi:hypothetical protein